MRRQRRKETKVRSTYNETASHYAAHDAGVLEVESAVERTHKVKQGEMLASVSANAALNAWSSPLAQGPYGVGFSRTGRHAVACGHGGRVLSLDLHAGRAVCDVRVGEVARAACFLHEETLLAVAQKKYVYVYDESGAEVHRMAQHLEPEHLSFLPFHFLLATLGHGGYLKYHDVSTGSLVSEHATKLGSAHAVAQNPASGVLDVGHGNGVVTLWSPAQPQALARLLAHRGAVAAVAHSACGTYLATGGVDGLVKVWDARTLRTLETARLPGRAPRALAFSQRGMLAVCAASSAGVEVYASPTAVKKTFAPYVRHRLAGGVHASAVAFRPFEDALLVGHARGVESIIVPGCSEPNYDALEGANPYRTNKQRKASTVRGLLDKLPPETIALEGADFVGSVERDPAAAHKEKQALMDEANAKLETKIKEKKKTRGRSKLKAKLKKRLKNVISKETNLLREKVKEEALAKKKRKRADAADGADADGADGARRPGGPPSTALDRLFKKHPR